MGMYNEVFKQCPRCRSEAMVQIKPQIVLGFGGFHLDDPEELAKNFSVEELQRLEEAVKDETFHCREDGCRTSFRLTTQEERDEKLRIAKRLAGLTPDEDFRTP